MTVFTFKTSDNAYKIRGRFDGETVDLLSVNPLQDGNVRDVDVTSKFFESGMVDDYEDEIQEVARKRARIEREDQKKREVVA
jgi:hypothetical protein